MTKTGVSPDNGKGQILKPPDPRPGPSGQVGPRIYPDKRLPSATNVSAALCVEPQAVQISECSLQEALNNNLYCFCLILYFVFKFFIRPTLRIKTFQSVLLWDSILI